MGVGSWTDRITEEVSDHRRTRILEDFATCSDEVFPEIVEGGTAERGEDSCGQLRRKT